jgi:hypothetical protein
MRTAFASVLLAGAASAQFKPTPEGAVKFLGGLLDGFAIDNTLTELSTCTSDAEVDLQLAYQIVQENKAGKSIAVAMDIASLLASLPETLSDCKSMTEDIARLK